MNTDILIIGGGVGGCAAALAATALGRRVVMTEPTAWIGGQLTSQLTPPDEHPWIESFGCTARWRRFRDQVRRYYQLHYPLNDQARHHPALNPGQGWVSGLCHEPRVALAVLHGMLAWAQSAGRLQIWHHHEPIDVDLAGHQLRAVTLRDKQSGERRTVEARYVLDASELGDVLPLAGVEYVTGCEARSDTHEPHAPDTAQPGNVQALTWCFAMAYDPAPGADHVGNEPAGYQHWRRYVPALTPAWTGPLLSWTGCHPHTLEPRQLSLFKREGQPSLFDYRRVLCADHFPESDRPHEITVVNWPQNDYLEGSLIDVSDEERSRAMREARELSLCLFHWLQTEAPRHDGDGCGYPALYLRPDVSGTADGLAMAPYIRESRRIKALFTVTENHVGRAARGCDTAETFKDSVGIGSYRIDLHPSTGGDNYIDIESLPFQIPLGALLPRETSNLIAACKNIGVTHISNGCYRLHPVEWNIGEAAGMLAAWCLNERKQPAEVHANERELRMFQELLSSQGVPLAWPAGMSG